MLYMQVSLIGTAPLPCGPIASGTPTEIWRRVNVSHISVIAISVNLGSPTVTAARCSVSLRCWVQA
jgi:hypothetical protein